MKQPRRWLAVLLNLLFPPAGYVYVGALRTAVLFVLAIVLFGIAITVWTFAIPPGIYAFGSWADGSLQPLFLALLLGSAAAIHVLFMGPASQRPSGLHAWAIAVGLLLTPLALGGLARAFNPVAVYSMASSSSEPTLSEGDIVAVRGARAVCGGAKPKPGDIVVYRRPDDASTRYIHRMVAGGGDTIEMREGRLVVNGAPAVTQATGQRQRSDWGMTSEVLRETLPGGAGYSILNTSEASEFDTMKPVHIPTGQVFIIGDNRDNALDSRFYGAVSMKDVCGVGLKVLRSKYPERVGRRP